MYRLCSLMIVPILLGCSTDKLSDPISLMAILNNKEVVLDNVIACAASNEADGLVSVFLYPRSGATNLQYFETMNSSVNKNDFDKYRRVDETLLDVFNGYLQKFEIAATEEKWVIVSFEEENKIHLSNPIRLKQKTKPTEYLPQNIVADVSSEMPIFSWQDGSYDDTKIYFQVISDQEDNLISGTYTFEQNFTYYDLDNVVLNITRNTPPSLKNNSSYVFTLMAVSEDNWVNQFSIVDFELN